MPRTKAKRATFRTMAGDSFAPTQVLRPKLLEEAAWILEENQGTARIVAGNTMMYDLASWSACGR